MSCRKDHVLLSDVSVRFVPQRDYDQWLPLWDGYNATVGRPKPRYPLKSRS